MASDKVSSNSNSRKASSGDRKKPSKPSSDHKRSSKKPSRTRDEHSDLTKRVSKLAARTLLERGNNNKKRFDSADWAMAVKEQAKAAGVDL